MCIEHRNLTWMLLFLAGVLCNTWKVKYQQQRICAVKGSSVVIPCSFHPSDDLSVTRVRWGHVKSDFTKVSVKGRFICDSSLRKPATRFQYIGNKDRNCSLKIHNVEHEDAGKYTVRFVMTNKKDRGPGTVSPTLQVVDLNILLIKPNGDGATKEGDSVNLTCRNSCDVGHLSSAFTWVKNGEPINEGPVLYLSNMTSANSGNYTCSLQTQPGTTSGVINIDVEYGPKNTSASVRPLMEVDVGSNITLICSSHANPPVENYTWFKIDRDDIMDVGHQAVLFSGDRGQFFCSASNKHGSQNSSVVTVKIKACWTFTRYVLISSTVAVLMIVTAVIAIRGRNRKRKWAPNTDCGEDVQDTDYVNWLVCDNQSQEGNQREGGTTELVYATINFSKTRKSNTEQQMDSHHDEDVIYSTVCRSRPLTSSYIEPP